MTAITANDIKDLVEKMEAECVDLDNVVLCVQLDEDDDVVYNVALYVDDFGEGPVLVARTIR
jgi:hypothetical protein